MRFAAVAVLAALFVAACGSAASPAPPSATPRPTPTPDPHLKDPATADEVFRALGKAGLRIAANNAATGGTADAMVKRINASYEDLPLIVTQFKTAADLRTATGWDPALAPGAGDPPYAFVGMNILVEWGTASGLGPGSPEPIRHDQAVRLAKALDPLLWPLEQRAVGPIVVRSPAPSSADPSASGSPAPSAPPASTAP